MAVITCAQCQKPLQIADSARGKNVRCPACGNVFLAPGEPEPALAIPMDADDPALAGRIVPQPSASPGPSPPAPADSRLDDRASAPRPREGERPRRKSSAAAWLIACSLLGLLLIGGAIVLLASGALQSVVWERHTSMDGEFDVWMPGRPEIKSGPGDFRMTVVQTDSGRKTFGVGVADVPDGDARRISVEQRIDNCREDILRHEPGSRLLRERNITLHGRAGREIEVEVPGKGNLVARVYMVSENWNHRFYLVMATGPEATPTNPETQKFLMSFRLHRDSAEPPARQPNWPGRFRATTTPWITTPPSWPVTPEPWPSPTGRTDDFKKT